MATILYGLSMDGNGHATRSKAIIERLKKDHKVIVITGGNGYKYLSRNLDNVYETYDWHLHYKNNTVTTFGTLWVNFKNTPKVIRSLKKINKLIKEHKPDIILNDFSAITSMVGLVKRIPLISIDNNQLVLKAKLDLPRRWLIPKLKAMCAIRLMVPTTNYRFISSFFTPELKSKRATIIPPIVRDEVKKYKPTTKNHILVYQTTNTNQDLIQVLKQIKHKFIVYGFDKRYTNNNVTFRRFSETEFLEDLASAKGVIMNGGFSLITECLYLKKPMFTIPIKNQIEQMINGHYVQKRGFGMVCESNDKEKIEEFINNIPEYKKNLKKVKLDEKNTIKLINKKIKELTK